MPDSMTNAPEGAIEDVLDEPRVPLREQQAAYIAGLRDLADFLEANPEIPAVYGLTAVAGIYADNGGSALDKIARIARAGGRWKKKTDSDTFDLRRKFGPHSLVVFTSRENVCERVVVGTETVTREVPDPEQVAQIPTVTVTETVEQVEWQCAPSLLAATDGES